MEESRKKTRETFGEIFRILRIINWQFNFLLAIMGGCGGLLFYFMYVKHDTVPYTALQYPAESRDSRFARVAAQNRDSCIKYGSVLVPETRLSLK